MFIVWSTMMRLIPNACIRACCAQLCLSEEMLEELLKEAESPVDLLNNINQLLTYWILIAGLQTALGVNI